MSLTMRARNPAFLIAFDSAGGNELGRLYHGFAGGIQCGLECMVECRQYQQHNGAARLYPRLLKPIVGLL